MPLLYVLACWVPTTLAAEDAIPAEPEIDANGSVTVRMVVGASLEKVHQRLDSAHEVLDLNPDSRLLSRESHGDCERTHVETAGLFHPLRYIALRCPTEDGWHEQLESSPDFKENQSWWHLTSVEGGTEITYTVQVDLDLPVGDGILAKRVGESMVSSLQRLADRLYESPVSPL